MLGGVRKESVHTVQNWGTVFWINSNKTASEWARSKPSKRGNLLALQDGILQHHLAATIKALRMNGLGAHFDAKSASTMRVTLNIRRLIAVS
jgi:hypothetical protein